MFVLARPGVLRSPAHHRARAPTAICRNAAASMVKSKVVLTLAHYRAKLAGKIPFIPAGGYDKLRSRSCSLSLTSSSRAATSPSRPLPPRA